MLDLANDSAHNRKLNLWVGQQMIGDSNIIRGNMRFQVPRQAFSQSPGVRSRNRPGIRPAKMAKKWLRWGSFTDFC
jgi:hypothetical protein